MRKNPLFESKEEMFERLHVRRRKRAPPPRPIPYGLRDISENDIERLALMKKMGLTIQAALKIMQQSVAQNVPDQEMTPEKVSELIHRNCQREEGLGSREAPQRAYRIDGRGSHILYAPVYYEKLCHVWLTCPKDLPEEVVEAQMSHLRAKGFTYHESETIKNFPHDRRTAIYFVVSNQTLPVRIMDDDQADFTSNDFETSVDSDEEKETQLENLVSSIPRRIWEWATGGRSSSSHRKIHKLDLKGITLVKTATLKYQPQ